MAPSQKVPVATVDEALRTLAAWLPADRSAARPALVLVAGGSCSGKTHFARALRQHLDEGSSAPASCVLAQDDYFRDLADPAMPRDSAGRPALDSPDAFDAAALRSHIGRLTQGEPVSSPVYDVALNRRVPGRHKRIELAPVVIVEGLHAFNWVADDHTALRVYIDADEGTRLQRRLDRGCRAGVDDRVTRRMFDELPGIGKEDVEGVDAPGREDR